MTFLRFDPSQGVWRTLGGEVFARVAPTPIADEAGARAAVESARRAGDRRLIFETAGGGEPVNPPVHSMADPEGSESIERRWGLWSPSGRERAASALRATVEASLSAGLEPLLLPRVGTMVSDLPGALWAARQHAASVAGGGGGLGLAIDTAAVLSAELAPRAADVWARWGDVLSFARVGIVVLRNVDGAGVTAATPGLLILAQIARAALAQGAAVGLVGDDHDTLESQRALLLDARREAIDGTGV